MKLLLAPLVLGCCCSLATAACTDKSDELAATYQVTETRTDNTQTSYNMTLWRMHDSVAHQYPQNRITLLWNRTPNGALHLERHFDDYAKGIEYQPLEINGGRGEKDWSREYQLVSDQLKDRMTLVEPGTGECGEALTYALDGKQMFRLTWMPETKLAESFQVRSASGVTTWTLTDINTDAAAIADFFTRHAGYQLTDYADIGDNEADPFIRNMINLGFIEHGASGVYDADGHSVGHNHE